MSERQKILMFRLLTAFAVAALLLAALFSYPLPGRKQQTAAGAPFSSGLVIDLNEADIETLCLLPGVGEKRAADIIAYRDEIGGFVSLEDLLQIPGIGEKTLDSWRDYVVVGE